MTGSIEKVTARYAANFERVKQLNDEINEPTTTHAARDAAIEQRQKIQEESVELYEVIWAEFQEQAVSEPVDVDRGLAWTFVEVLLKVQRELEKELERTDLTPFIWSTLKSRYDLLAKMVNVFNGRGFKRAEPEPAVRFLLVAEFDDDTVDFEEAHDEGEADEMQEAMVDAGAIVHRYRVAPEHGVPINLFAPVMPFENVMKRMTRRQFEWVLNAKGRDNLTISENIEDFVWLGYKSEDGDD